VLEVSTEATRITQSPVIKLPEDLPNGRELVAKGRATGDQVEVVPSAFCELHGVRSEAQFKAAKAAAGELTWSMIMGQASVDEQVEALKYLHELGSGSGYVIDRGLVIPDWTSALPPDVRDKAPKGTSFVLDGLADHIRIAQASPIQPGFNDWHIGSPYCLENTLAAVAAGGSYHGVFAQYAWDMPLVHDDVERLVESVTAIGVIASRRNEWLVVDSYMDDGMPSHFVDNASLVGYALLEKYVVDELCGARYATGFGGLISDIPTKIAVWLALHEVLKAEHPCLSYLYGNTISPSDTYLAQNFGVIAPEMAVFAAVEKRYCTGVSFLPTPITEKIEVPTPEAIGEARMAAGRAAARAAEFDKLIDWSVVESMRDVLVHNGRLFFRNALALLAQGGVDMRDPLQVLLAMRRVGAHKLEELCHPGEREADRPGGIVPFLATELLTMAQQMAMAELKAIRSRGLESAVKGRRFIVASADTHWYGSFALRTVLEELGAIVVDAGAECDPEYLAEMARKNPCAALAVSTHNGQCLSYGSSLTELLKASGLSCPVFIGGKLNAILEGDSEPSDMCSRLREIGVVPCDSVAALVESAVEVGSPLPAGGDD
jgi:methylmalonyl-CoA mutase cobalamin-binding subunit